MNLKLKRPKYLDINTKFLDSILSSSCLVKQNSFAFDFRNMNSLKLENEHTSAKYRILVGKIVFDEINFSDVIQELSQLTRLGRDIRVVNGYNHFQFHSIPDCGSKKCELPIVEIGSFEETSDFSSQRPKLLITSGLDGTSSVSISNAMNFIKYLGITILAKDKNK